MTLMLGVAAAAVLPPQTTLIQANCEALMLMSAADVGSPQEGMYIGIPVEEWPRVVLSPSFAPCLAAIKVRVLVALYMFEAGLVEAELCANQRC
jgi:hypothetical protein